ncbi:alpha/beta fold hydrolase [Pikeienuella piscinae]|uniref:Alpha/beta fold hydrolase n=1 Tax=Pikeienuella piscinae TaxID=2748098 RepID=A0A7L5BTG8_9RHOB|nr:alpha/beta fold hydrolase [Pikeienuella piscinae]QIE54043.1 alpha/beta fold hydrolase [Pikeienuella piscinae]
MSRHIAAILSLDVVGYSARMAEDAEATLRDLQRILRTIVRPLIRESGGRVVKLMGDGALAEFGAAGDAIRATQSIQQAMRAEATQLRAGVHVGDVTVEGDDIFGDAVNIAARLQEAARPGGALVSRAAVEMAGGGIGVGLRPEGALRLKGLARPVEALALDLDAAERHETASALAASQQIRFATSRDGARLAWTAIGDGPALVKAPNWISHLECDWRTPFAGLLTTLTRGRRLIRFDQRGNGLSDRTVPELSVERFVDDLEAVFDAAGVERAPVFGLSQGAATAAAFAARHPERVSALICLGGFAQGGHVRSEPRHAEFVAALDAMARTGWDDSYPSIRDHFARIISPGASAEDHRVLAEAMREMITAESFGRFRDVIGHLDVTAILPAIRCPALLLHAGGDRMHPLEQGRRLAAGIPDSRFVVLDSVNHLMPADDQAWPHATREIEAFLAQIG